MSVCFPFRHYNYVVLLSTFWWVRCLETSWCSGLYLQLWPQLYRIGSSIYLFYECIEVSEALQSVMSSSHSIIIISHSYNTLRTLAKLLAVPDFTFYYLHGFTLNNLPSNHSLHHATTLYSILLVSKPPSSPSLLPPVFPSLPSNCIPHAIQATPLFSNFNHCLWQSCCMSFYNPPFPATVCWGCTTRLHDRLPFYSLFENLF